MLELARQLVALELGKPVSVPDARKATASPSITLLCSERPLMLIAIAQGEVGLRISTPAGICSNGARGASPW